MATLNPVQSTGYLQSFTNSVSQGANWLGKNVRALGSNALSGVTKLCSAVLKGLVSAKNYLGSFPRNTKLIGGCAAGAALILGFVFSRCLSNKASDTAATTEDASSVAASSVAASSAAVTA